MNKISTQFFLKIITCFILLFGGGGEASVLLFTDELPKKVNNAFVLDVYNQYSTFDLQFGGSIDARIQFNNLADSFSINRDLDFEGNQALNMRIENLSSSPTCDANVIGRVYHDTTDTQTYVCNGSGWIQIDFVLQNDDMAVARYRENLSTNINLNATDNLIPWNIEDFEDTVFVHDTVTNNSRIQVNETGNYLVSGSVSVQGAVMRYNGRLKFRLNGVTDLPMRFQPGYIRNGSGQDETALVFSTILHLSASDYFEVLVDRESTTGDVFMIPGESSLSLLQLKGPKGDTGSSGDFINGGESTGSNRSLGNTDSFDLSFLTNNQARISIRSNGDIDLNNNQFINARIENASSDPTCDGASIGKMYFNTTDSQTYMCDGTEWSAIGNGGITVDEGEQTLDYNTIPENTMYVLSDTSANRPSDESFIVKTLGNTSVRTQTASNGTSRFYRVYQGSVWSSWEQVKTSRYALYELSQIDQTDGSVSYISRTRKTDSKWLITRSDTNGFTFAQEENNVGVSDLTTAWNNRLTLNYNSGFTP